LASSPPLSSEQKIQPNSNAAKAGLKNGDNVIYTSSFFGDELWPADNPAFVKSATNSTPNAVDVVIVRGDASDINVKRLNKRDAPSRFGRKLTATQRERATHICASALSIIRSNRELSIVLTASC
jgi:hypothetical protein